MLMRREKVRDSVRTVAILGVGLIGGSIGLALRARGIAAEVVGDRAGRGGARSGRSTAARSTGRRPTCATGSARPRWWSSARRSTGSPRTSGGWPRRPVRGVSDHRCRQHEAPDRRGGRATAALAGGVRRGAPGGRLGAARRGACPGRPVRGPTLRADADVADARGPAPACRRDSGRASAAACWRWARPSTTRSWPTPATCRTPWPPRWPASVPAEWLPLAAGAYRDGTRVAAADTGALDGDLPRQPRAAAQGARLVAGAARRLSVRADDRRRRRHPPLVGRGPGAASAVR